MRVYTEPCTCDVCGGPGLSKRGYAWLPGRHTDPAVCAYYLKERAKELEERERKVRETEERLATTAKEADADGSQEQQL